MKKKDIAEQWKVNKIEQLKKIHTRALIFLYVMLSEQGMGKGIDGPYDKAEEAINKTFCEALENPDSHPLLKGYDNDRRFQCFEDDYWPEEFRRKEDIYFSARIATETLVAAIVFNQKRTPENDIKCYEDLIDLLARNLSWHEGYQFSIGDMKSDSRKKKAGSGKGQKIARERRLKAFMDFLQPLIKDGEIRIDKGEYYQLLCKQFIGSEKTPRDPKTVKSYKKAVEERTKSKIIWEKGTFIR